MNGLEIYNEILENTHNLKGTWEVTEDNYLNVTGNTNGSIVLFDKTVGALGDFILEWTAEQKGGRYIHSNLCPSLRYTPEDAGIEGGGDNYSLLVYLCSFGGNTGTFNFRTENGTKSDISASGVSLNIDTVYTFKLERLNGMYRLYQDDVLINEATDITKKKLYLGWYLWFGGSNSSYQTNFILREYNLTKIDTKSYLDSIGLTSLWSKIKSLFATKTELASKANDSDVVHKSGDETIAGSKTFSSNIVGNLKGNADTATTATNAVNCPNYLPLSGGLLTNSFVGRNVDDSFLHLSGCTDYVKGSMLIMYGENNTEWAGGGFRLIARNSSSIYELDGYPNGNLAWGGKNIVRSVNGATADSSGNVIITYVSDAGRASIAGAVDSYTGANTIKFNWGDQVKGFVGLKVDRTEIGGIVTTDNLPALLGGIGVYDIGSTIHACTGMQVGYGETIAGSNLKYAGLDSGGGIYDLNSSIGATGTWVKVSGNSGNTNGFGLYRRIA